MLKTVLKVLAFYVILSAIVSGCSLISDYCKGVSGKASNDNKPITAKAESKETDKHQTEQSKQESKNIKIVIDNTMSADEELYIELSNAPNIKHIAQSERFITLQKDLPRDLIQIAFNELKKRKKFYTIENNR